MDWQPSICEGDYYQIVSPELINSQVQKVSLENATDTIEFNPLASESRNLYRIEQVVRRPTLQLFRD